MSNIPEKVIGNIQTKLWMLEQDYKDMEKLLVEMKESFEKRISEIEKIVYVDIPQSINELKKTCEK